MHSSHGTLVLLLYDDDMLLTGSYSKLLIDFIKILHSEFSMIDLGPVHHILTLCISLKLNMLALFLTRLKCWIANP